MPVCIILGVKEVTVIQPTSPKNPHQTLGLGNKKNEDNLNMKYHMECDIYQVSLATEKDGGVPE